MSWLFQPDKEPGTWQTFMAEGFQNQVCGCIYKGGTVDGGLPLGGLGTGYVTLESNGELGRCTIFPRGDNFPVSPHSLNQPFLAITCNNELRIVSLTPPDGIKGVSDIRYWGHFPVADLLMKLDLPLRLALRAFTPFVLGDADASNTPVALFEISLFNESKDSVEGDLAFSFPGQEKTDKESPTDSSSQTTGEPLKFQHQVLEGRFAGVMVSQEWTTGFALIVNVKDGVQSGSAFGTNDNPWTNISNLKIKTPETTTPGASLVVRYSLEPGEEKRFRFALGWFYPYFCDSGNERHRSHYLRHFKSPDKVAEYALSNFDFLLERTLAWQEVIYNLEFPIWLKDGLVNSLYTLAKNTLWVISDRPDNWYIKTGFFVHSESFTGCPINETMVCRMHGHFPLLFFFPELERSTLFGFKHYQISDGEIPFSFGWQSSLTHPTFQMQHPLVPGQYVQMIYQYYLRTGDRHFLQEFYESAKKAVRYQQTLDYDKDGLVNEHSHVEPGRVFPANQFYDIWPWFGTSAYVAGTWLATLRCAEKLAKIMDDESFAEECRQWCSRGQASYEEKLWNGKYYRLYNDPENGRSSEVCLGNQLMGQWCAHITGVNDVLPLNHIASALESIVRLNFSATQHGLVNGMNPDATPASSFLPFLREDDHGRHIFFGENMCSAMTFVYNGKKEKGLEIAKRLYEAMTVHHRTPWNQRCLINSKDGSPVWGDDYYSNLVIWTLPMALANQNIKEFCQPGGLIASLLKASTQR